MSQIEIMTELEPLFHPRSVAVIGATNNLTKWGFSTFYSLMRHYQGDLYAVNNRDSEILGRPAYARVTDIPGPVDLAVIVIPPEKVAGVMAECVEKKVKASVIITAGFAEIGPQGKARQDEVVKIARQGGIRLVGPNCMGMWSAAANLTAFMFPLPIMKGPLSLVSQGGNVGGALVADAVSRGIGFQYYVSCGCTADIQIEDYIEYMGHDDSVKVIMVYIEGLADGERFVRKVKPVTLRKPVIALKPGKTDAAARAISSHSGALSGSNFIYEAAFKKAGVIRADTTMELLDVAIGLLTQPLPRGRNVVITTPGGSYGVMCADACASLGLNVIDLPSGAMETFNAMFPSRWSHGNPVDPAGDRNLIQYL
ncbi:MAG: CoA-binding protein, partial [Deltaproteobacteria bacterium]|nr:CoA-binding protein [Deltaproteobacteria bacterium]